MLIILTVLPEAVKTSDRIPLRAMGPVYLNEYQSRSEYYDGWLQENSGNSNLPESTEQRLNLLIEKREKAYQQLCDIVYEKKGYTSEGIPKRETVKKFGLMDEQASQLLDKFGE
jgi:aldehyde:ferredoxin oxidoreductase